VPPFDREGALKSAEKALKLGKIDAAIAEYVKIVEAQPRDWNSANALGDLYVRAGQTEKGISQYVRIADTWTPRGSIRKRRHSTRRS
jgi:Flp pilus assembly protein TadD